ncbi:alpha-galactosidase [Allocoprobacillus halotolerans]|uniref:alpha-galactosidase n=2 Tax=Allocoprobacillus halotolerans TaxID=2944914 RepID=A0ABY5I7F6_9FIRM|nr:alpha-galactosidase [Allocoprobacillus halotolerans]UTY40186.1 alpha-galactosidase [Allocoprobacillus halotolerans]
MIIEMIDYNYDVVVKQYYTIFENSHIIVRNQEILNKSEKTYTIDKAISAVLDLNNADYKFVHLSGAWLKERHVKKQNIEHGKVSVGTLKGASSHQQNPFIALEHVNATINSGECYGMNLVYSGNFIGQVEVDEWDYTRMMLGINPEYFNWELKPESHFLTPEVLVAYSNEGLDGLSREYASFIENHIIDSKWLSKPRPIVYNSWEAMYFDMNQEKLYDLAVKAKDIGMECFVIDDGWFSNRRNDQSSLGDWTVSQELFPDGIKAFGKKIHGLGMMLGMWFEPEMVSPGSQLVKDHPDWVAARSLSRISIARNQYCLDFSNPEVVDYIYNQMVAVIDEANLDYIKWDYNRNITEAFSPYLEKNNYNQGEFFHRNILGLYDLYERLTSRYPNLLIEGCAGGGGRFDLGILYYSPYIWVSDDSDAIERLKIQYGTSLAYPISSLSNHVSITPNHQTLRNTPLQTRYLVALFGCLGYELDINELNQEEIEAVKKQIQEYKEIRYLISQNQFYRLISPFEEDMNKIAWAIEGEEEVVVGFYRILTKPNDTPYEYLKLPFIKNGTYLINDEYILSGEILRNIGLKLPYQFNCANHEMAQLSGDYQAYLFRIKKVK